MIAGSNKSLGECMAHVLFVSHTAEHGGGELGLARYLASPMRATSAELLVLGGTGILMDEARANAIAARSLGDDVHSPTALLPRAMGLFRALTRSHAEVVVANDYHSAVLLALLPKRGKKFVYYMRNGLQRNPGRWFYWFVVTRILLRRFDAYIANSRWTLSTLPADVQAKPGYIATPVSGDSSFDVNEPVASVGLRVLTLSRLTPWKGIHVLVEALRIVHRRGGPSITLTMAGRGEPEYMVQLSAALASAEFPWRFAGSVKDIRPLLEEADVVVCPSIEPEPFGQVIVQGLASGRLVVATDEGGAREILEDSDGGFLVRADDPVALADELDRLGVMPARERFRRSEAARKSALRFDDRVAVEALDSALSAIANDS